MPRPKSLTTQEIAAAGLAVADRAGGGALSMRAVAAELGLTTMALYRYVADRGELERLVVDLVLADLDVRPPPRAQWRKQLTVLMERIRRAIAAHPAVIPLALAHRQDCDGVRRAGEAMLGVLTAAGFTGQARVIAFRTLLAYLAGALQAQQLGAVSGKGTQLLAAQEVYPILGETARAARGVSARREFHGGLQIVLAGLESVRP